MKRLPFISMLCCSIVCVCAAIVHADEPIKSVRGLANHVDVEYAARLRSRADQSPTSKVLVRVSPVAGEAATKPTLQRIEFIGTVVGTFDLREFIEREDGRAIAELAAIPVIVGTKLPADAGTDLYSSGSSWFNWAAHYRTLLRIAVALWFAVPALYFVVRAMRKPPAAAAQPMADPTPTIEEQLIAAIRGGASGGPSVEDLGRLELLVFRYFGGQMSGEQASPDEIVETFRSVRLNPETRPVIVALEQWLHARGGERTREDAAQALELLRSTRLQGIRTPGVTP